METQPEQQEPQEPQEPGPQETPQETREVDFNTAIPVGGTEAGKIAERMQAAEMQNEGYAPRQSRSVVDDTAANEMIAELYAMACDARAETGPRYEHWRVDDDERAEVRDKAAPAVKDLIPRRILAKSKKLRGAFVIGKHLLAKRAQDPSADEQE